MPLPLATLLAVALGLPHFAGYDGCFVVASKIILSKNADANMESISASPSRTAELKVAVRVRARAYGAITVLSNVLCSFWPITQFLSQQFNQFHPNHPPINVHKP
jgi:hypothetical protein